MNDSSEIISLEKKIGLLERKIDSTAYQTTLKQLEFKINESQNIILQVNEFYDSAWLKLVIVISILGVIIPVLAQYFQRRNLKDLTNFIQTQLNEGFELKLKELKEFNKTEIENSINVLNEKLKINDKKYQELLNDMDTSTLFLQGRTFMAENDFSKAISSFLRSANLALNSNERIERVGPHS